MFSPNLQISFFLPHLTHPLFSSHPMRSFPSNGLEKKTFLLCHSLSISVTSLHYLSLQPHNLHPRPPPLRQITPLILRLPSDHLYPPSTPQTPLPRPHHRPTPAYPHSPHWPAPWQSCRLHHSTWLSSPCCWSISRHACSGGNAASRLTRCCHSMGCWSSSVPTQTSEYIWIVFL